MTGESMGSVMGRVMVVAGLNSTYDFELDIWKDQSVSSQFQHMAEQWK